MTEEYMIEQDEVTSLDNEDIFLTTIDISTTPVSRIISWGSIKTLVGSAFGAIVNAITAKTTPVDNDFVAIGDSADSNATKKLTLANLATYIATKLGVLINALTGKTTPVDADELVLSDSAASNASKKLTWANAKATLKTYFDTLYATVTGGVVNEPIKRIVSGTGAITTTEAYVQWNTDTKTLDIYDTQRERALSEVGWMPFVYAQGATPSDTAGTALALAANGGSYACPVFLSAPMLLESVTIRNTDTGTARSWNWALYAQYLNNGNSGENTLTQVAVGTAAESFTPGGAASNRTITASGNPVYLAPGNYWIVIQNNHAVNNFGLGIVAGGTLALNTGQTKTLSIPVGSTLDFVAATWTKVTSVGGIRLNGRVFGQTTGF